MHVVTGHQGLGVSQGSGAERIDTIDAAAGVDLATVWGELIAGRWSVVGGAYTPTRCYVSVEHAAGRRQGGRLATRRSSMLERSLLGESLKVIAIDLGLSVSTISLTCSQSMGWLGLGERASRVPILIVMAAHAARGFSLPPASRVTDGSQNGGPLTLFVDRPEQRLAACLSAAEYQIVRLAIEGKTHAEMAAARSASPRTIANQLAAVFRKLGVSGRRELIATVVRRT